MSVLPLALMPRGDIPKALVLNSVEVDEGGEIDVRHTIVMNQTCHLPLTEEDRYALSE